MKALLKQKTLTVFFSNGDIVTNTEADKAMYLEVVRLGEDEDAIRELVISDLSDAEAMVMVKKDGMSTIDHLIEDGLFTREDDAVYRVGIKLSIPELVLDEYLKAYIDRNEDSVRFQTIDNFWKWLSLCPNAESREDLYTFLSKHGMSITPQGMVLAYRRVVTKHSADTKQITAISNLYIKVKTKWKMNPINYDLVKRDNDYRAVKPAKLKSSDTSLGNLDTLYRGLADLEGDQFTDNHTKTYDYKIGVENRMDRGAGNQSNRVSCSGGFHLASKHYDYSYFGDEAVLCIFNPMDTLAVPHGEHGKLRVCAFTILSVLDGEEENTLLEGADLSELVIDHYIEQVNNLENLLKSNTPYELAINNVLNSYEYMDMDSILDRARESIKGNLIQINEQV